MNAAVEASATGTGSLRHLARLAAVPNLVPGTRVSVVTRSDPGGSGTHFTRLSLWTSPSSDGPVLAQQWEQLRHDPSYLARLRPYRGPTLRVGDLAVVVALLPEVSCPFVGSRPWVLLLSDRGQLGWCYALDGLRVLAPAGGSNDG